MLAQSADAGGSATWAPRPGEPAVLKLAPDSVGVSVRFTSRTVNPAHDSRLEKLARAPSTWGAVLAGLTVLVLVSTAFATGTVRPAPPRVPTPRPGEPTPTPDTRPKLLIGGFVLLPPLQPTAVPAAPAPVDAEDPMPQPAPQSDDSEAADQLAVEDVQPTPVACTNLLGIGCGAPAPPRPLAPRRLVPGPQPVVPVPSPAAFDDLEAASPGPPRGSSLEAALQAASIADDNFAREVDPSARDAPPEGTPLR